ncbi:MAG TPA: tetratricopeptide repeat protein [Chloroflexia bacterium]|nr:tetratricopeptide repeat protein [Chloroflexia bacterium]
MNLEVFRRRIREYCRPTGYSQKMLAHELGLQPTALSNKLNGTGETSLKHTEAKQIIKILADWEALSTRAEAVELLELVNLKENSFTPVEWNRPPLNKLEAAPPALKPPPAPRAATESGHKTGVVNPPAPASPPEEASNGFSTEPLHNLPVLLTPLIGRERQTAEVIGLLSRAEVRLLTLTGPGGVGKTRLAMQVATEIPKKFAGEVFFVPLATVSDSALVLSAIAGALSIREAGSQGLLEMIKIFLRQRRALLVLDNFEQILLAAGLLKGLLEELPGLKMLVTSRARLQLYGEYEYCVPPLALPDPAFLRTPALEVEQLAAFEAIALFVARARAARPGFKLTPQNAGTVVEICRRLDGLPLALELAAARVRMMSPEQILIRLEHSLDLLGQGPLDLPARQQTLRALIDWSFDLLEPGEKALMVQLAVFVGGCDLEAAEAICLPENATGQSTMLDKLAGLVDKSMLQMAESEPDAPLRFKMLAILREYALEKLQAGGTDKAVRDRHAAYFLSLTVQAEVALASRQQKDWLDRLETEHDNFRAALGWALKTGNSALALGLVSRLAWFWDAHGHLSEGRNWLKQALHLCHQPASEDMSPEPGEPLLELRAKALNAAGNLARKQDDSAEAVNLLKESLALRRRLGQPREIAQTLNNLGVVAYHMGDLKLAQHYYEESLALKYRLGDKRSIGLSLNNLGEVARETGELNRAIELFEEGLALLRAAGDSQNTAGVLLNLGVACGEQGDYGRSALLLTESLELLSRLGDKFHMAETLEQLAILASKQERLEIVARLDGAAGKLRQEISAPLSESYRASYEQEIAKAQDRLDPRLWQDYREGGQRMDLQEAISFVKAAFGS